MNNDIHVQAYTNIKTKHEQRIDRNELHKKIFANAIRGEQRKLPGANVNEM